MGFGGYYGCIRIGDGMRNEWIRPATITCKDRDGTIIKLRTHNGRTLKEFKRTKAGKITEWLKFGEFHRFYRAGKKVTLRFYKKSLRKFHGWTEREDQTLFGKRGNCRTLYSHGRFIQQEFRYKNRRLAFKIRHNNKQVIVKYPDGKIAGIVECPERGFSTRSGDPDRYGGLYGDEQRDVHSCFEGKVYFETTAKGWTLRAKGERALDYSRDGNCSFQFFDRSGKVLLIGSFRRRQRVGVWKRKDKEEYYLQGIPVSRKMFETKPEALKVGTVFKLKNAQLRAALLALIGPERIAKEGKYTLIHETKNGMKLMEFPILVDDGNGGTKSKLRILQVTCPSTNNLYYLPVPDFVWDGGNKTKLDTCEQARQWTFGIDNPRKKIKFTVET